VRGLVYALAVPPGRLADLPRRIGEVLASPSCWVERTRQRLAARASAPEAVAEPGSGAPEIPIHAPDSSQGERRGLPPPASPRRDKPSGSQRRDLRPMIRELRLLPDGGGARLEMDLYLTPAGTARPDEVLGLLGLRDLLDEGTVLERTRLVLEDDPPAKGVLP
jgi:hypothetical protein